MDPVLTTGGHTPPTKLHHWTQSSDLIQPANFQSNSLTSSSQFLSLSMRIICCYFFLYLFVFLFSYVTAGFVYLFLCLFVCVSQYLSYFKELWHNFVQVSYLEKSSRSKLQFAEKLKRKTRYKKHFGGCVTQFEQWKPMDKTWIAFAVMSLPKLNIHDKINQREVLIFVRI